MITRFAIVILLGAEVREVPCVVAVCGCRVAFVNYRKVGGFRNHKAVGSHKLASRAAFGGGKVDPEMSDLFRRLTDAP